MVTIALINCAEIASLLLYSSIYELYSANILSGSCAQLNVKNGRSLLVKTYHHLSESQFMFFLSFSQKTIVQFIVFMTYLKINDKI